MINKELLSLIKNSKEAILWEIMELELKLIKENLD